MQKIIYIDIYYIYIYSCFFTSCIPRSGDLRNTIFVFSWSHLDAVNFFLRWAGVGDVARRGKTEEANMWTTHLSLVVAALCSRLRLQFVRGCPKRPWCDMYSRYNGGSFSCFFPLFLFFSSAGSSKKNARYSRKTYCLLLLAVFLLLNFRSFSRFFLRQSVCTRAARWLYCINAAAYHLK